MVNKKTRVVLIIVAIILAILAIGMQLVPFNQGTNAKTANVTENTKATGQGNIGITINPPPGIEDTTGV